MRLNQWAIYSILVIIFTIYSNLYAKLEFDPKMSNFHFIKNARLVVYEDYHSQYSTSVKFTEISLPYRQLAQKLFGYAGVTILDEDAKNYDCTIRVYAKGHPIGELYNAGDSYINSGAKVYGSIVFDKPSAHFYQYDFYFRIDPPRNISIFDYNSVADAPFYEAWKWSYGTSLITLIYHIFGLHPLINMLNDPVEEIAETAFDNLRNISRASKYYYYGTDYTLWEQMWKDSGCSSDINYYFEKFESEEQKTFLLKKALQSENNNAIYAALELMIENKIFSISENVLDLLEHDDKWVRRDAMLYLTNYYVALDDIEHIFSFLSDEYYFFNMNDEAESTAVTYLKNKKALSKLAQLLNHENCSIASKSATAICEIGDRVYTEKIIDYQKSRYLDDDCYFLNFAFFKPFVDFCGTQAINTIMNLGNSRYGYEFLNLKVITEIGGHLLEPIIAELENPNILDDKKEYWQRMLLRVSEGREQSIPILLRLLKDSQNAHTRRQAAIILGQFKDDEVNSAFINLLDLEKDLWVLHSIISSLGDSQSIEAVKPLVKLLNSNNTDTETASYVIDALGKIRDKKAIKPITKFVQSDSLFLRKVSVVALGNFENKRVEKYLLASINDKNDQVRAAAVAGLARLQNDQYTEHFIRMLVDTSKTVCINSIKALENLKAEEAIPPLIELLQSKSDSIFNASQNALITIGKPAAKQLIDSLSTNQNLPYRIEETIITMGDLAVDELIRTYNYYSSNDDDRKRRICNILENIDGNSLSFFKNLLNDPDIYTRENAAKFLYDRNINDTNLIKPLISALNTSDYWGKYYHKKLLVTIGEPAIVPLLDIIVDSTSYPQKYSAIDILVEMNCPRVINPLKKVLLNAEENDKELKNIAARALGELNATIPEITEYYTNILNIDSIEIASNNPNSPYNFPDIKLRTIEILGYLKDPAATEVLIRVINLQNIEDKNAKEIARNALVSIGSSAVVELVECMNSTATENKQYAIEALGSIKSFEAIDPLISLLNSDSNNIVIQAHNALKMITGRDLGYKANEWLEWRRIGLKESSSG